MYEMKYLLNLRISAHVGELLEEFVHWAYWSRVDHESYKVIFKKAGLSCEDS